MYRPSTISTKPRPTRRPEPSATRKPTNSTASSCPAGSPTRTTCAPTRRRSSSSKTSSPRAKPVGVTCHGPWTLIEGALVKGRKMTSWPSLQTDLRNAGAEWVDEEVVVDQGLVSSRKPEDIEAFNAKIIEEFEEGKHAAQRG